MNAIMGKIAKFEFWSVGIMIAFMAIINFLQVIFRYIIQGSLPWSEELLRFLFVWSTFLGASIGIRKGAHLGLTVIVDRLSGKAKQAVTYVNYGLCIVFCAIIAYFGVSIAMMQLDFNVRSSAMAIPMYWVSAAIPVSFSLMILHIINLCLGNKDSEKARVEN